jgi:hypothetical protein
MLQRVLAVLDGTWESMGLESIKLKTCEAAAGETPEVEDTTEENTPPAPSTAVTCILGHSARRYGCYLCLDLRHRRDCGMMLCDAFLCDAFFVA